MFVGGIIQIPHVFTVSIRSLDCQWEISVAVVEKRASGLEISYVTSLTPPFLPWFNIAALAILGSIHIVMVKT